MTFRYDYDFSASGVLYDATQHYPNSFYLGGGVTMLGALVMIPVALSSRKSMKKNLTEEHTYKMHKLCDEVKY